MSRNKLYIFFHVEIHPYQKDRFLKVAKKQHIVTSAEYFQDILLHLKQRRITGG